MLMIPLWMFSHGFALVALGAFLMQFMIQGAWGVVPAHINELSPTHARAFMPGFAYQIGVLISASAPYIEASLAQHFAFSRVLGASAATIMIIAAVVIGFGPEAHQLSFAQQGEAR
jgi:MFS transporter, SHS family, lactate transporter